MSPVTRPSGFYTAEYTLKDAQVDLFDRLRPPSGWSAAGRPDHPKIKSVIPRVGEDRGARGLPLLGELIHGQVAVGFVVRGVAAYISVRWLDRVSAISKARHRTPHPPSANRVAPVT